VGLVDNVIERTPAEYKRILHSRGPKSEQYHLDGRRLTTDGSKVEYSDDDAFSERRLFASPFLVTDGTLCALCGLDEVLYLFYVEDNYIKYRTSDDSGVNWSESTTTILTKNAGSLDAVVCNNEIYIFLTDDSTGHSAIYYITSSDNYAGKYSVTASSDDRRHVVSCVAGNPFHYSEGVLSGSEVVMLTFTHNDIIYLIMSDEGMSNWDLIPPIGITCGHYSDIDIGSQGYPVVTFTWGGKLYMTTGLITSQWTRPQYIGEAYKFTSLMRGHEKIDVVFDDAQIECLRYGHSLSVMSAVWQKSVVSYDTPGHINGTQTGGQYVIAYGVNGGIKVTFSDMDEALSIDRKYSQLDEGVDYGYGSN